MPRNTQYYSQAKHSVVVNGRALTDFDGDECITWEYVNADKVSVTEGFDGSKLSIGAGSAGRITVKLKPTSASIDYLNSLAKAARAGNPTLLNVAITTGVNENHSLVNAIVMAQGGGSGGAQMSARTFVFVGETLQEQ